MPNNMVSNEKLDWINSHLRRNDKRSIQERTGVSYNQVVDILRGRYYGENGSIVIATASRIINNRERRLKAEKKKYSSIK